jgi:hypothetical protein
MKEVLEAIKSEENKIRNILGTAKKAKQAQATMIEVKMLDSIELDEDSYLLSYIADLVKEIKEDICYESRYTRLNMAEFNAIQEKSRLRDRYVCGIIDTLSSLIKAAGQLHNLGLTDIEDDVLSSVRVCIDISAYTIEKFKNCDIGLIYRVLKESYTFPDGTGGYNHAKNSFADSIMSKIIDIVSHAK